MEDEPDEIPKIGGMWSSYNFYLNVDNYFAKMLDIDTILGLFFEDKDVAVKKYREYMNEEYDETFIDLKEEVEVMDEEEARELFQKMVIVQGLENKNYGKV